MSPTPLVPTAADRAAVVPVPPAAAPGRLPLVEIAPPVAPAALLPLAWLCPHKLLAIVATNRQKA